MAEGATLAVVAAEANRDALEQQGAEGEGLAKAPVDVPALGMGLRPGVQEALDLRVHPECRRHARQPRDDL